MVMGAVKEYHNRKDVARARLAHGLSQAKRAKVTFDKQALAQKEKNEKEKKEKPEESENSEKEQEDELEEFGATQQQQNAKVIANSLKLKEFDVEGISLDAFILVIGKRRYGKTTWARWVLSKNWEYFVHGGFVFTKTRHNG